MVSCVVGIYATVVACGVGLLHCVPLPDVRFCEVPACEAYVESMKVSARYSVPDHPVVMGRCKSWSPPMGLEGCEAATPTLTNPTPRC